ncbi:hypothetical protein [Staphylococcus sp. GDY8P47P]|uniref:hypothetical protein n=1 Tax=Staphylococcus sp. GDY8P47P TaxID=2804491 RepID=UPI00194F70F3|nr:hypothetical protein [Staphylococcus sp. GDY8P47P]
MISLFSRQSCSFISTLLIATIGYFTLTLQLIYLIEKGENDLINTFFIAFQILFVFLLDAIYQCSIYSYNARNTDNKAPSDFVKLESFKIKVMSGFFALVSCLIAYLNQIGAWNQDDLKQKGIIIIFLLFLNMHTCIFNSRNTFYNKVNKDPLLFFEDEQDIKPIIKRLIVRLIISVPVILLTIAFVYKLLEIF